MYYVLTWYHATNRYWSFFMALHCHISILGPDYNHFILTCLVNLYVLNFSCNIFYVFYCHMCLECLQTVSIFAWRHQEELRFWSLFISISKKWLHWASISDVNFQTEEFILYLKIYIGINFIYHNMKWRNTSNYITDVRNLTQRSTISVPLI